MAGKRSSSETFDSFDPRTGEVYQSFSIATQDDVYTTVTVAHDAAQRWRQLGYKGRKKVLLRFSDLMMDQIEDLADIVSSETGKPFSDAQLEITMAAHHVAWAARHAADVLRTSHRSPGALMANMSARVEHVPVGVVGVIGPWNYPVFTPMGSIAYALAAGNTVVFKPSEYTPAVGVALADLFEHAAQSGDIFQVITGLGPTGAALCTSGVNKIAFTGSTATAKKVAALCAQNLIPLIAECGGKDPVIVARDADIKAAVDATLWSAMANAGQSCIGAERVYVEEEIADLFTEKLLLQASQIHAGEQYGPATMPSQIKVIQSHIKSAQEDGGVAALGGDFSVNAPFVQPVVLLDVPEDSDAMVDETFGPTLIVNRVPNIDTAIRLSNASKYGLGASVWSRRQGQKIASQLQCGMVAINSAFTFAAVASIPFGGYKESGYGRIHGPEGLHEFVYPRSIVRARFQMPLPIVSFRRNERVDRIVVTLAKLLRGRLS